MTSARSADTARVDSWHTSGTEVREKNPPKNGGVCTGTFIVLLKHDSGEVSQSCAGIVTAQIQRHAPRLKSSQYSAPCPEKANRHFLLTNLTAGVTSAWSREHDERRWKSQWQMAIICKVAGLVVDIGEPLKMSGYFIRVRAWTPVRNARTRVRSE